MRTPDHGKLAPWRVISVSIDQRDDLAKGLKSAYLKENPGAGRAELEAMENMAHEAPCLAGRSFLACDIDKNPRLGTGVELWRLLHEFAPRYPCGRIPGWLDYRLACIQRRCEGHVRKGPRKNCRIYLRGFL